MDPTIRMSLEIFINFKDQVIVLTLPEKSNVYDLFEAIQEKTGISPHHQTLFGLSGGPLTLKETDIPLVALGLSSGQTLLLVDEKPPQAPRKKNPHSNTPSRRAPRNYSQTSFRDKIFKTC